jgi:hypothetical protein
MSRRLFWYDKNPEEYARSRSGKVSFVYGDYCPDSNQRRPRYALASPLCSSRVVRVKTYFHDVHTPPFPLTTSISPNPSSPFYPPTHSPPYPSLTPETHHPASISH